MEVAHGDHDKTNNRLSNLRYVTHRQNMNDGHPRKVSYRFPWAKVEVSESFITHTNAASTRKLAEGAGRAFDRAFQVEPTGTPNRTRVTRRPMLGGMTCSASANVGGPQ